MITVDIVTTWGDRCGTSEHARHILEHALDPEVTVRIQAMSVHEYAKQGVKKADIVHVNESGSVLSNFEPADIGRIQSTGSQVLLTMNSSIPTNNKNPYTELFNRVVVFEPHTTDGFSYLPIGAPVWEQKSIEDLDSKLIATNGFPQERKNLLNLAEACQEMGWSLVSFGPESQHADAKQVAQMIRQRNPSAITYTNWVSDGEMLSCFEKCIAACYPYLEWYQGSSSAAMVAVSARIPLIVSRSSQFDFLFPHQDEVYFIEALRPTKDEIVTAFKQFESDTVKKIPQKLYAEHRWDKVGQQYINVYKGMVSNG